MVKLLDNIIQPGRDAVTVPCRTLPNKRPLGIFRDIPVRSRLELVVEAAAITSLAITSRILDKPWVVVGP